ncbi:MAG TPA: hypothetical protein VHC95_12770 [Opitutales bacterium]|nr:hypothetical protein [Opitutales bacterium]
MKTFPSFLKTQLLGASLLVLATVPAYAGSKGTTYPVSLGNTYIGGKDTFGVTAQSGATLASFALTGTGSGNLLGTTTPLVSLSVTDAISNGKPSVNCSFVVGTYTVYSKTVTGSLILNGSVSQVFAKASSTLPVSVGGVNYPVSLGGTLSGSGAINVSAQANLTSNSVTVSGTVSDTVAGTVAATVPSSSKAKASVTSNLSLGTTKLTTNSTVATTAVAVPMSGSTSVSFDALNLSLTITLTSTKTKATIATVNLANYVAAARSILLINL